MPPASEGPSLEQQESLLRDLFASRQFAHADNLKRILRYLVDRWRQAPGVAPKEYEIAVQALNRADTFDPRIDPIVRVCMSTIRERLAAYYASEGRTAPWRLEVPRGQYLLQFQPAPELGAQAAATSRPVARFWKTSLEALHPNVIVYTEPLFFCDGRGRYFRDWHVNRVEGGTEQIRASYHIPPDVEIEPVYHYLSSGEMHCLLSLTRLFHEAGVPVETRNCRQLHWNELSRSNVILLGSPRTNPFLRQLQEGLPMIVHEDHIDAGSRGGAPATQFQGRRYRDGALLRMTEYAVVTRRSGIAPGSSVTLIAANHGRAIEGAAHTLTVDSELEAVLAALCPDPNQPLPERFQILLRVETVDIDDQVSSVALEQATFMPD